MSENSREVQGILEMHEKGYGFLRGGAPNFTMKPNDPHISHNLIRKYYLREGLEIKATIPSKKATVNKVDEILEVGGFPADHYMGVTPFDEFTVIDPNRQIKLETGEKPLGPRMIDLMAPIGFGQRGLIVAPPRTGKTILLQEIAHGVATNHPEAHLIVLLIDERPEEVTDMRRSIDGEVIASCNDWPVERHVRTAKMALARAKRLVELGKDVVILLDSLTRLGRAFNNWTKSSGRTMSGGLDIKAMQLPKQLFGAARNVEDGGSLTIIATALIETGSRMDEVIFQEFKGTGNMELVLDRQLANRRTYPAINIPESGTRKEELLIGKTNIDKLHNLRRHLDNMPVGQDIEMMLKALRQHKTNASFMKQLP
ncbi:MAG: transcription termination factor Rho [Phycisphaerae bacterium]|nr:transcription termination factor Rho [Phycisphaerae bacterium]